MTQPQITPARNASCHCGSGNKYKKCCLPADEAKRKNHTGEDAVLICMPTRGQISYETSLALANNLGDVKHKIAMVARKPVAEARNILARNALDEIKNNSFDFIPREFFVLWIDDDAWWLPNVVSKMLTAMHAAPAVDVLFGKFGQRTPYSRVLAFRDADDGESFPKEGMDCGALEVVPIETAGFHFVLMRGSVLKRIGEDPFTVPAGAEYAEDSAFCKRALEAGIRMYVAMGVPVVHVDPRDGVAYLPGMPAMMLDGNTLRGWTTEHATPAGDVKMGEVRTYGLEIDEMRRKIQSQIELEGLVTNDSAYASAS